MNPYVEKKLELTTQEQTVWDEAIRFARSNKKTIGKRLTDKDKYPPETEPVSVFMAGSPGAGKTEASLALLNLFSDIPILRIDPDDLRCEFQAYKGGNAWLFIDYHIPEKHTRHQLMVMLGINDGATPCLR